MKKFSRLVLAVTAASTFAVTACSGPSSQPASQPSSGGTSASAPTQEKAPFKKYSEAELSGLLKSVKSSDGTAFTSIPAAQLKQGVDAAKTMAARSKVTPAECGGADVSSSVQTLDGAVVVGGVAGSAVQGVPGETLSLVSGVDESALFANLDKAKERAVKCKEMTIEVAGQTVKTSMELLDVQARTPGVLAIKSSTTLPGGGATTQVIVTASKGGVSISTVRLGVKDAAADAAKAAATVDAVAEQIK